MKKLTYFLIGAVAIAALGGGGTVLYTQTRGFRNNNPTNIRKSGDKWQGLSDKQTDLAFFQFKDVKWGIRAAGKILRNYRAKYGLNTIYQIIGRWAPPSDNNPTDKYAKFVADFCGVGVNDDYDVFNDDKLVVLIDAIIKFENGFSPYSRQTIVEGVKLI